MSLMPALLCLGANCTKQSRRVNLLDEVPIMVSPISIVSLIVDLISVIPAKHTASTAKDANKADSNVLLENVENIILTAAFLGSFIPNYI
jgi:hypothetical protein